MWLRMPESNNIQVPLEDLAKAFQLIAKHIQTTKGRSIEISQDYYWEIAESELYDPTKDPSDLSLGQLSHDWERLQQLLAGEAPPIGYAMVWLAAVLRAVGQNLVA
jgi:hypothetical protein